MKKLFLLLIITCFMGINSLHASHGVGAEITYTYLGGNTYRFELVYYRDCFGVPPSIPTLSINGCGITSSLTLAQVGSTTELGGLCPNTSTCSVPAGTMPGVQRYVFQGTYTFANQCDDWTVSFGECCISNSLTNIIYPSAFDLYTEAHLNNLTISGNSSPIFNTQPIVSLYSGVLSSLDFSTTDIDGDDIEYSLIYPFFTQTGNIFYANGTSITQPMCSVPANSIVFNSQTGSFDINPCANQQALLAVKATEYRLINGVRTAIGSVIRNIQVLALINTSQISAPSIYPTTNISGNTGSAAGDVFHVCPGSTLSFHVRVVDNDVGNTIAAVMNGLPQGANATITGTNPVDITFTWTPTNENAGQYIVSLQCFDNSCPVNLNRNKGYVIIVHGVKLQSDISSFCKTDSLHTITLNAHTPITTGGTYTWSATPTIPNFNPANNLASITTSLNQTTTFHVLYTDNICNASDSITIQAHGGVEVSPAFVLFNPATSTAPLQATAVYTNPIPPIPETSGLAGTAHTCIGTSSGRAIGTGLQNTSTTGGVGSPFQGNWHDGRFQMLLTAAELQAAGLQRGRITRLAFNITQKNSTIPYNNFTIKMGATSANGLSAGIGFLSNNSTVYTTAAYTTAVGTASFVLQSPYFWNGLDNLVVELCFDNTNRSNYDHVSFTPTVATKVLYKRVDGSVGCNLTAPLGTLNRPDIVLYNCPTAPQVATVTYAWSSQSGTIANATTANALLSPTGTLNTTDRFILTATDGTCTSSDTVVVLNTAACGVSAAIHENSSINCINTTAELDATAYSVGTGALSYAWSTGETTPIVQGATSGIYTVTVTAAGAPSCTNTATIEVAQHINVIPISIATTTDSLTCSTREATLTVSPIGAYSYNWSIGNQTTHTITLNTSGIYTITVTDLVTGCTASASITIGNNIHPPLAMIYSNNGNTINCYNPTVTLDACNAPPNANYSYSWDNGNTVCGNNTCWQGGSYTVTVTDNQNNCTAVAIFSVIEDYTVNNNQLPTIETNPLSCGNILLTVPNIAPAHTFLWSTPATGNPNTTQNSITANMPGLYTVVITNTQSGCSTTLSYLSEAFSGGINVTAISDCNTPTGMIMANMQGGVPPYQVSFDNSFLTSTTSSIYYIQNIAAGAHLVTIQSTDGCILNLPITTHCTQAVLNGIVFNDLNSNGLLDATETPITHQFITATQAGQTWSALTNNNGVYSIDVPTIGNYTLDVPNLNTWQTLTTPQPINVTALLNDTTHTNLGIHSTSAPFDLSVHLSTTNIRPGFNVYYNLFYRNTGNTVVYNAVLKLIIQGFVPNNLSCNTSHSIVNDTLIIPIGDIQPSWSYSAITVGVGVPATTPLGAIVNTTLLIEPVVGDTHPADNISTKYSTITGSYDPNDKQVNIENYTFDRLSTGAFVRPSPELAYTIRFQNTGTDTAFTIRVNDTLSSFLNIPTLKLIGSSHPCTVQVDNNRVATFTFNNIRLIDSTHNEAASHGFVYFTIQPNDTLVQSGIPIRNRAAIYFDYNAPIITNEVQTTPSLFVITVPEIDPKYSIKLSPNPTAGQVAITPDLANEASATLLLRDALGRVLSTQIVKNGQTSTLSVADLPQGVYLTEIWLHDKLVAVKKLVKM